MINKKRYTQLCQAFTKKSELTETELEEISQYENNVELKSYFDRALAAIHSMRGNASPLLCKALKLENSNERHCFDVIWEKWLPEIMDMVQLEIFKRFNIEVVLYTHGENDQTVSWSGYVDNIQYIIFYDQYTRKSVYYDKNDFSAGKMVLELIIDLAPFVNVQMYEAIRNLDEKWSDYKTNRGITYPVKEYSFAQLKEALL